MIIFTVFKHTYICAPVTLFLYLQFTHNVLNMHVAHSSRMYRRWVLALWTGCLCSGFILSIGRGHWGAPPNAPWPIRRLICWCQFYTTIRSPKNGFCFGYKWCRALRCLLNALSQLLSAEGYWSCSDELLRLTHFILQDSVERWPIEENSYPANLSYLKQVSAKDKMIQEFLKGQDKCFILLRNTFFIMFLKLHWQK